MANKPTMALVFSEQRIEPGGTVMGELRLRGGAVPTVIDRLCTRVWARVHAYFDDDDGAAHVRLSDGTIAKDLHLGAGATVETEVHVPVPWSVPVTRSNGARLRGLSVVVDVWGEGPVSVNGGPHLIEVDPLPWQQRLLTACEQSGLRWETNVAGPGGQTITSFPLSKGARSEVTLGWQVHRRSVTVELLGHRRQSLSFRLTHAQATRLDWADELAEWLTSPKPTDRARRRR